MKISEISGADLGFPQPQQPANLNGLGWMWKPEYAQQSAAAQTSATPQGEGMSLTTQLLILGGVAVALFAIWGLTSTPSRPAPSPQVAGLLGSYKAPSKKRRKSTKKRKSKRS